ncbi:Protein OBERON 4 [Apostasia shenzhenica]|uniref:Protein OBERON 4 n=1 Tax=Apostasia shenzhenica TaxID=1088818 RepID=A0A2I0ADF8_9ASPA|nr:Protein OBERON 4 [Apostasia shenzhenica]
MKRPRSYEEDLDEASAKDWSRREIESERPSSHRRFYSKPECLRRVSSSLSYDRSVDEDREALRPPRKRIEHESDGFDRRKSYDRYLDGGSADRSMYVPSPRGSYGTPRMHRSESFSVMKREVPKGFRSERDRSRRDGSGGSSWRRLSSGKGPFDEGKKSLSGDSEDQSRSRSRDTSSGDHRVEMPEGVKEKSLRAACSSSEMEEGELEPDPETEPKAEPSADTRGQDDRESAKCKNDKDVSNSLSQSSSQNKETSLGDEKREVRSVEMEVDQIAGNASVGEGANENNHRVKELNEERKSFFVDCSNVETFEDISVTEKKDSSCAENSSFQVPAFDIKHSVEEQAIKEDASGNVSAHLEEAQLETREGQGNKIERQFEGKEEMRADLVVEQNEGRGIDLELDQHQGDGIDLEAEAEDAAGFVRVDKEVSSENNFTLMLMTEKVKENRKGKGKGVAVSLSKNADLAEDEDAMGGPNARDFDLVLGTHVTHQEKASNAVFSHGKGEKNDKLKLEPLDLSLSLPIDLQYEKSKPSNTQPRSPGHARSIQSLPSSFRTISDGFTTSISFSSSQPFVHNPSCSLTHNSMENYEQSVGSHPLFQGVDQVASSTVWQAQTSSEAKRKGGAGALFQRVLLNGNSSHKSFQCLNGHENVNFNGPFRQSSLPRQLSPTHSLGSHDTRSEHSKDKRTMTREMSSNSLFRIEQREWEQHGVNGQLGVVERIISRIVSESLPVMGRMIQEMTEHSVTYMKAAISKMLANTDKCGEISALQEALHRRSDLTAENMQRCPRTLLEIFVAVKTGLSDFLQRTNSASSSDLIEIFLNSKCQNLACRSILPVDDCDCKVCSQKNGFCSACMCIVCSKFDMASNTCSWVGCDVCLHWCHTDCGLRDQHIRNGRSSTVTSGATEMQFNCVACGHPSEMFGFVKEVFKTCSKDWKVDNLAKELHYVRRIFLASNDLRGKGLCHIADQMLEKLEDKTKYSEVISYIMTFLSENDPNLSNVPSSYIPKESLGNNVHPGKVSHMEPTKNVDQRSDPGLHVKIEKKPIVDELESVVRYKQAEAKMYQERADNARREAEGLKRIAMAKSVKVEEEHSSKIAKLQIHEAEERRRQKFEELQASERAHQEFINMKTRMQAEITDLLLKMESTKRNFNA